MKYLEVGFVFLVLGVVNIQSLPIDNETEQQHQQLQTAVVLPAFIPVDEPIATETPSETVVAAVPISLLDIESHDQASVSPSEESQRTARGLGGFGGLGGLGGKFGGLGLGFKSLGGFGSFGFGGLHGFGGGFGGFKPFFGKHFG